MDRIRLLFLADCLRRGGSERQLSSLLNHLFPSDELEIQLMTRNPELEYDLPDDPYLHLRIPCRKLSKREYFRLIYETIKDFRPSIVHAWEKTGATGAALCKLAMPTGLVLLDGTSRFARTLKYSDKALWTFKFNHSVADVVVGNSKASLGAHGHVPENTSKYLCIPNGIDLGRFPIHEDGRLYPRGPHEFVMVANFTPAKDHLTVIGGFTSLMDEGFDIRLSFVGDGPLRSQAKDAVPERHKDRFAFLGKRTDVDQILMKSSIGLLLNSPGHAEGMSNAVMEYMAAALPVICTDAGGNRETVEHGRNGYLIPYRSEQELMSYARDLVSNYAKLSSMGTESRKIAEETFSLSVMAEKYLSLYKSLVTL